jgi:hypothetical protein
MLLSTIQEKFENAKKSIVSIHLITFIIINIIRLRELYSSKETNTLLQKIQNIQHVSKFVLDMLNFNLASLFVRILPYLNLKKK